MSEYKRVVIPPDYPFPRETGMIAEHVMIAELTLGRRLKVGEHVHHVDKNGRNNARNNLVICRGDYHISVFHPNNATMNHPKDVVRSNVMLGVDQKAELEILAEQRGMTISALIREAIALYLKGRKQ